jgi:Flp pilus assembly protein TadD
MIRSLRSLILLAALLAAAAAPAWAQEDEEYVPGPADSLIDRGAELHDRGDYGGAIRYYDRALRLDPGNLDALYEKALSLDARGQYRRALRLCDRIIRADSLSLHEAFVLKSDVCQDLGLPDSAVAVCSRALLRFAADPDLYSSRGMAYCDLGSYQDAERDFVAAVELSPGHANAHYGLAWNAVCAGDRAKAVLALYSFLLHEKGTERARQAFQLLLEQWGFGSAADTAGLPPPFVFGEPADVRSFRQVDSLVAAIAVWNNLGGATAEYSLFGRITAELFRAMSGVERDPCLFWGARYVSLFDELAATEHLETCINGIARSFFPRQARAWQGRHGDAIAALDDWIYDFRVAHGIQAEEL